MVARKKYQTLNMCNFCSRVFPQCGANPVFVKDLKLDFGGDLPDQEAVLACDTYESPIDVLKRQFH